ncbi:sensor histidine kinase [Actimicrobium sp. CCI2.3]|uniref:sensor histidine kinase n=1 Tax=Actimicrobium sp. CCI2.3 TaxID=3048616 RepID=UPI002AB414BB|nr:histidine kinase [Actimicrobium sp. CCI2.3]MDY7572765.1 histidine kinase [Actimicrobium sp. CCI2.3]MEB0022285.1 histidine kinase [Actimicrobium sp. CCI2.3]
MPILPANLLANLPAKNTDPARIVIPDYCNTGVILRVLALVNLVMLLAIVLQADTRSAGLLAFIECSLPLELVCMLSLVCLCGMRRHLPVGMLAHWQQRLMCALVPALMSMLVLRLLLQVDWFRGSFPNLSLPVGALLAALFGAVLQHYLELRARAFSPALGEAQLQALQARIRPHFLFNSLNAVLALIRRDPRRAETALEDLGDLFRVLMRDGRDLTSLADEIRLCEQYLSIEKIRLGERLQVSWDTSAIHADVLRQAQIPSLLLQPLFENAVHYGVEPSTVPALIRVELRRVRDSISVVISNPWLGKQSGAPGNHMALENIRGRLRLLYDLESSLSTAVIGAHFEVRLFIPYKKVLQ